MVFFWQTSVAWTFKIRLYGFHKPGSAAPALNYIIRKAAAFVAAIRNAGLISKLALEHT